MTDPGEFERGHAAGEIAARLANHDQHFATINGSIARVAEELHAMRMEIQRQGDRAEADRVTVRTTADALKEAEDARREAGEQRWTPMARIAAVAGALAAIAGIAFGIWSLIRP